jgi:hypothetical protein
MPVIPVEGSDWDALIAAAWPLFFAPNNATDRRELSDAVEGSILLGMVELLGPEHFKLDLEALTLLRKGTPRSEMRPFKPAELFTPAFIAGDLLLTTLRLAIHQSDLASLENAIKIVGLREKQAGRPASRASLLQIWGEHRPVSHLCAAFPFAVPAFKAMARALITIEKLKQVVIETPGKADKKTVHRWIRVMKQRAQIAQRSSNRNFPKVFAMAERLRGLGQKHYSRSQKKPLLDEAEMWTVPSGFQLPHVRLRLPPITAIEYDALKSRSPAGA